MRQLCHRVHIILGRTGVYDGVLSRKGGGGGRLNGIFSKMLSALTSALWRAHMGVRLYKRYV